MPLGELHPYRRARSATGDCVDDGTSMLARCHHSATVVTIDGYVDAANVDRVGDFATRFAVLGCAVILDLRVTFFAVQSVSMLFAVDDAYSIAGMPWVLVGSPAVDRVTQLVDCRDTLPLASSVSAALRQLTALTRARRHVALPMTRDAKTAGNDHV